MKFSRSTHLFLFGDCNLHQKDCLTYSGGTDRPGEICYNFSMSKHLTQMINFSTWIPDCDSHSPPILDLLLFSDAGICSAMAFPQLKILIMLLSQFPLTFHQTQNDMPVSSHSL